MDYNTNDLKTFIKDKLDILDKSNSKYKNYINTLEYDIITKEDTKLFIIKKNEEVIYSGKLYILGFFDTNTRIWIWSWSSPTLSTSEIEYSKKVLDYGLMLEPTTNSNIHYYMKPHLVNSRLFFENSICLDIHLGLILYISKGKFIKSKVIDKIVIYYLIF